MSAGYVPARKVCRGRHHSGSRWILAIYFDPLTRHDDGSVKYLQSECKTCQRRRQLATKAKRARKRILPPDIHIAFRQAAERERKEFRRREQGIAPRKLKNPPRYPVDYVDVLFDVRLFRRWLVEWANSPGRTISDLSLRSGIDDSRIRRIHSGYEYDKTGRRRRIKNITLDVIVNILEAADEGYRLVDVAPDRAIRGYRWKSGSPYAKRYVKTNNVAIPSISRREFVPDVIGEYLRKYRSRKAR